MANVFISHRTADMVPARRLANDLRTLGHNVWLDDDQISIGDSIVEKINEGLEGATYLVLCLSGSGVDSSWISREWMSTLARQLNGANVKILPAQLTGTDLPAILADLKYADLASNWNTGFRALGAAIR